MNQASNTPIDYYRFLAGKHWIADPIQALFMSGPRRALFKMLMARKPQQLLDVCCGSGAMAGRFTARGVETTGVDVSASMLERATEKGRLSHSLLMDVGQMDFNKEFDAAYINLAIHEMDPELREVVWQKTRQAVRDGGMIAIIDLNATQRTSYLARFWHGFFELDERNFLQTNPQHYTNYRQFMDIGGLSGWMNSNSRPALSSEKYFFAGNIGVLSVIV